MDSYCTSIFADITCCAWGIHHTHYQIGFKPDFTGLVSFIHFDFLLLFKVIGAGIAFGLVRSYRTRLRITAINLYLLNGLFLFGRGYIHWAATTI